MFIADDEHKQKAASMTVTAEILTRNLAWKITNF